MKFEFQKEKMEKIGVAGIFLFGSRAQGISRKSSDFDFAILIFLDMPPSAPSGLVV